MKISEAWLVAIDALRANRLRSGLTMLGVVIGVAAVVLLVAIGSGAKAEVERQVEGLGSNLLIVVPGELSFSSAPTASRLRLSDVEEVARIVGDADAVTATVTSGERITAGTRGTFATLQGTMHTLPGVFDRPLARGEYFSAADVDARSRVIVLGAGTAEALFPDRDPLGQQVSVAGVRFRVIGVLAEVGATFAVDRDLDAHIPVTTAQRLVGTSRVDVIAVKAPDLDTIHSLGDEIVADLSATYEGTEFTAVTQEQILGVVGRVLGLLTLVLAAIAGISLLVGGVGVSNIMLVTVRERTREIGLRIAVGARQRDITTQFLLEAVVLTVVGGVTGLALGTGAALLIGATTPLPTALVWWSPLLAFSVSAAVGIFFGVAPARRAGRLDPVAALRSD